MTDHEIHLCVAAAVEADPLREAAEALHAAGVTEAHFSKVRIERCRALPDPKVLAIQNYIRDIERRKP